MRLATLVAAGLALTGCGKAPATAAGLTISHGASTTVGIPANYQPGVPVAGAAGTPSLRAVDWPSFTHTAVGDQGDPVNLVVAGSERQVRRIFALEGWLPADKTNALTAAKMIKAALTDSPYPTAPMSDLYLYNRTQDMAMQKNGTSARDRDHLRVWKTPLLNQDGLPVWAIAATHDVAIKWAPGDALPTHEISPDVDAERSLVVADFLKSREVVLRYQLQQLSANFHGVNGGGDEIFSDGKVECLELNPAQK